MATATGIDLGNILAQAEGIKGQRNVNALNQQQFQANALAQQGGNQFNQLLQQHLANPTPQSANALVQADPQRAQQVAQAQGAQASAQQGQTGLNQVQAQKTIGEMDLIINSKAPKRMAQTLFQPEQIAQFEQASGETIEEMDDSEVLALATRIRDSATPSAGAEFIAARAGRTDKQREAGLASIADAQKLSDKQFDQLDKLVTSAKKDKRIDNFIQVETAFDRIEAAEDTAAGDISLIFAFMKMNDPGSTVREGEFATAQNATGVPGRIKAAYNRALEGTRLTPTLRADFKKTAENILKKSKGTADKALKPFEGRAKRFELRPETVREAVFGLPETESATPAPNIPQAAIDFLKADPGQAAAFDQKFGDGAARSVLGG